MDKKKIRQIVISLVVIMLVGVLIFGGVAAYWVGVVNKAPKKEKELTITIGEGDTVTAEIDFTEKIATENKMLVPTDKVGYSKGKEVENVDKYVLTLEVELKDKTGAVVKEDNIIHNISATAEAILSGKSGTNRSSFVNVKTPSEEKAVVNGDKVLFLFEITLNEPKNQEEYEDIIGQNIKLKLTVSDLG